MQHVVFKIFRAIDTPHGRMPECQSPVKGNDGKPLAFEDQRAAYMWADRLNRIRMGADYARNVEYQAGWIGEWK